MSAHPSADVAQLYGFARSSGLPALTPSGTAVADGDRVRNPIQGLFERMARRRLRRIARRRMNIASGIREETRAAWRNPLDVALSLPTLALYRPNQGERLRRAAAVRNSLRQLPSSREHQEVRG